MRIERLFPIKKVPYDLRSSASPITSEQQENLHKWDQFIADVDMPKTFKEKWEEISNRIIEERNKKIGWNSKK